MSVTTATCNQAKKDLFDGVHDSGDAYKCLLLKVGQTWAFDKNQTGVGTPGSGSPSNSNVGTDEVAAGGGYTAGGVAITRQAVSAADTTNLDFDDAVWAASTISAVGCIVYNDTKSGKPCLLVQSFGGTVTSMAAEFRVTIANLLTMSGS